MRKLILGFALVLCPSVAGAQDMPNQDCAQTSDGLVCDPFDPAGAVRFQDGMIGVYLDGQDDPWVRILNPNNPLALPPNPIRPVDPYMPVILTRPGA